MQELLIRKVLKLTIDDANELINALVYVHTMEKYERVFMDVIVYKNVEM